MNLTDVKKKIDEWTATPADILALPAEVQEEALECYTRKQKQTEYEHAKRVEESLAAERKARLDDKKGFEDETKSLRTLAYQPQVVLKFDKLAKDRHLDDKQIAFARPGLEKLTAGISSVEAIDGTLNTFIDEQLKDYDRVASLFGVKKDAEKTDKGAPPGDSGGKPDSDTDFTNPDENPFIPGGKAALTAAVKKS